MDSCFGREVLCDPYRAKLALFSYFDKRLNGFPQWPNDSRGAKLILFDSHAQTRRWFPLINKRIVRVAVSFHQSEYRRGVDISFPAPAVNPAQRSMQRRQELQSCKKPNRRFLISFVGRLVMSRIRQKLGTLDNGKDIIFRTKEDMVELNSSFKSALANSEFAAVPRGDALFSYRFAEVLSYGAIPVIYADGWVLPFSEILNYSEFAVVISERDYARTREILERYSKEERCKMRTRAYDIYWSRMASTGAILQTVVDILDSRLK
mmetsp:Transcript_17850/g.23361  ORF Transcript_17850/g.23361 Transcript_17850/m.23361 type:complete len:264 (-) Transcript_17850:29-820(-)